ncbi:hypothetical protein [Paenibacillus sp. BJ-4]|uniref:hypothetical protein n=1 Tax=Paenibacillus sp. BJ-4 TaxID=2878097 RepID=UPI001CF07A6E|nr:hypothetical protein [Paenibacillus sp. BJ-4]
MTLANHEKAPLNSGQEAGGPRYTLGELKEHAEQLFSVKEEVLAGAFFGEQDKLFTVAEAHTKIEQFMKAKVD